MIEQVAPAVPSPFTSYWREVLLFFLGSAVVNQFIAAAVADRLFMRAYERCKDQILARQAEWNQARTAVVDDAIAKVAQHDDQLEGFEESLLMQGKALNEQIEGHFARNTLALETMTRTLEAVQREANATAVAVGRLEGRLDPWDGHERRDARHPRREGDSQ